jgi:hypothetical protein
MVMRSRGRRVGGLFLRPISRIEFGQHPSGTTVPASPRRKIAADEAA